MTIYVTDASVLIEYLIQGPYTANAVALFDQATPDDKFIVPEFALVECTNVLWKQVRFQKMPNLKAEALLKHFRKMPLSRVPVKSLLGNALRIGLAYELAVYDSVYIALAKRSHYPLLTIDQPQSRAATAEGVIVKPITDFAL